MNALDPKYEAYYLDQLAKAGGDSDVLARDLLQRIILFLEAKRTTPAPKKRGRPREHLLAIPISAKENAAIRKLQGRRVGKEQQFPWPKRLPVKVLIAEADILRSTQPSLSRNSAAELVLRSHDQEGSQNITLANELAKRLTKRHP